MADSNRTTVSVHFSDGEVIQAWESLSLRDTYTDPLGSLEFTARPPRSKLGDYRERLQKGQLVTVKVNDVSQGGFLVCTQSTTIDRENGTAFKISCKSPLATLYEASVDPDFAFKSQTDTSIAGIISTIVLPFINPTVIAADASANVDAITGKPRDKKKTARKVEALKHNEAKAQDGESVYAFISRITTRLGVFVRFSVDGEILLGSPDYEQSASYKVHQTVSGGHSESDRMLEGIEIVDTNDNQYSECQCRGVAPDKKGQKQTGRPKDKVLCSTLFPTRPPYRSAGAPAFKPLILTNKSTRDATQAKNVATLALGYRAKDAFTVTCDVDGFISRTGRIWSVDTVCRVVVEDYGLDEDMWLLERTLTQSREDGQKTRLKFIPLNSLVIGADS